MMIICQIVILHLRLLDVMFILFLLYSIRLLLFGHTEVVVEFVVSLIFSFLHSPMHLCGKA